jgi:hypothetical protein
MNNILSRDNVLRVAGFIFGLWLYTYAVSHAFDFIFRTFRDMR